MQIQRLGPNSFTMNNFFKNTLRLCIINFINFFLLNFMYILYMCILNEGCEVSLC